MGVRLETETRSVRPLKQELAFIRSRGCVLMLRSRKSVKNLAVSFQPVLIISSLILLHPLNQLTEHRLLLFGRTLMAPTVGGCNALHMSQYPDLGTAAQYSKEALLR